MVTAANDRRHPYPLFLVLTDRAVLVVGGGAVAERRVRLLVESGAIVTVVAPAVTEELQRLATVGAVRLRLREFASDDVVGQTLAFAATGIPSVDRAVATAARSAGSFVNVADDAESSDFHVPAVERRGDIQIAVGTGGAAPGLAARLRDRFAATLAPEWVTLAGLLGDARKLARQRIADADKRMRALARAANDDDLLASIARGSVPSAERLLERALDESGRAPEQRRPSGRVAIVGAGPGSPDLITVRGLELLGQADVVLYDDLVDRRLVEMAPPHAEKVYAGKRGWRESHDRPGPEALKSYASESEARKVVRLKGGDPSVFGRLDGEIAALREAGIDFEVVPGVTAATAAAAAARVPLTSRGHAASVTLATAVVTDGEDERQMDHLAGLAARGETVALYMGGQSLPRVVARFLAAGVDPRLPLTIVVGASTNEERVIRTTLAEGAVATHGQAPSLAIIGATADRGTREEGRE